MAKFKRILLKLSGESLMGKQSFGIDPVRLGEYAEQIKEVHEMGVQIGIVIGGGNIFRGLSGASKGFDRVKGDQMGMCATVINSLALSSALGALGVKTKVLTAIRMEPIGEFYSKWKAIEAMEAGYVCIFSAGTGSPYFTTDTGSSLRGIEIEADVMLKGTRVRRHLHCRSREGPDSYEVHRHHLRRNLHTRSEGDGPHRYHNVQGEQPAYLRVQHGHRRQPEEGDAGRGNRHIGTQLIIRGCRCLICTNRLFQLRGCTCLRSALPLARARSAPTSFSCYVGGSIKTKIFGKLNNKRF